LYTRVSVLSSATMMHTCVCVFVCARARAHTHTHTLSRGDDARYHVHASIIISYPDGGRYDLPLNRTMAKLGYANVEAGN